MKDKDLVYLVALDVRDWAEKFQKTSPGRFWQELGGLCAIASGKLFNDLKTVGVEAKIVKNNHHCFLLVDDYVVDITATQFMLNYPKITIAKKEEMTRHYWKIKETFSSVEELIENQKENKWPEYQLPFLPGEEPV